MLPAISKHLSLVVDTEPEVGGFVHVNALFILLWAIYLHKESQGKKDWTWLTHQLCSKQTEMEKYIG